MCGLLILLARAITAMPKLGTYFQSVFCFQEFKKMYVWVILEGKPIIFNNNKEIKEQSHKHTEANNVGLTCSTTGTIHMDPACVSIRWTPTSPGCLHTWTCMCSPSHRTLMMLPAKWKSTIQSLLPCHDKSLINNNNNNVHLSCAHQRPERSHDTY